MVPSGVLVFGVGRRVDVLVVPLAWLGGARSFGMLASWPAAILASLLVGEKSASTRKVLRWICEDWLAKFDMWTRLIQLVILHLGLRSLMFGYWLTRFVFDGITLGTRGESVQSGSGECGLFIGRQSLTFGVIVPIIIQRTCPSSLAGGWCISRMHTPKISCLLHTLTSRT